jgi:hypothetical protein
MAHDDHSFSIKDHYFPMARDSSELHYTTCWADRAAKTAVYTLFINYEFIGQTLAISWIYAYDEQCKVIVELSSHF